MTEIEKSLKKYIYDLEKQLAEKDEEILVLQEDSIRDNQIYNVEIIKLKQEKTDFAIEQLEKVKEEIDWYVDDENKEVGYLCRKFIKKIDNQIKELKE